MLETFLQRLINGAGKNLPPSEVACLVAEAREHLEDSIQARLELGMSLDEAEREAIAAFSEARPVAQEATNRATSPRAAARIRLLAAAYA